MEIQYVVSPVEIAAGSGQRWERARRPAGGGCAMRVIAREREHYEVHEVPYGKVYSWRPERIVFECDCGERLVWMRPVTACACGAVHTDVSRDPAGGPVRGMAQGEGRQLPATGILRFRRGGEL